MAIGSASDAGVTMTPYDGVTGNDINSTSYPCVKHFWRCEDATGRTLVDHMGNANITKLGSDITMTVDGNNAKYAYLNMTANAGQIDGALAQINNKPFMFFQVMTTTGIPTLLLGNTGGDRINCNATSLAVGDGTVTCNAMVGTGTLGRALIVFTLNDATTGTEGQGAKAYGVSSDLATVEDTAEVATTGLTAIDWDGGEAVTANSNMSRLYGAALFVFDGDVPSDYRNAIHWMTAEWLKGNKVIYPGWRGIA